jgi:hypothetical protein
LSFFSDLTLDFAGRGLGFTGSVFLGVDPAATRCVTLRAGFGVGFGVTFGFGEGVAFGFAAVAVGFGVADGNSISLFAVVTTGFSSASFFSSRLDSVLAGACFGNGDSSFSDSSAERSPAAPNHMMLSGFAGAFAATLQRIKPAIRAMCASAIRTTFRQNPFTPLNR